MDEKSRGLRNDAFLVTPGISQTLQDVPDSPVIDSMYYYCKTYIHFLGDKEETVYPNADGSVKTGCANYEGYTKFNNYTICLAYAGIGGTGEDERAFYADVTVRHADGSTNTIRISRGTTIYAANLGINIKMWV